MIDNVKDRFDGDDTVADQAKDAADSSTETASDAADGIKEAVGNTAESARSAVDDAGAATQESGQDVGEFAPVGATEPRGGGCRGSHSGGARVCPGHRRSARRDRARSILG